MGVATLIQTLTFEEWLEKYYQYRGSDIEDIEKQILDKNRRMVDEFFEEDWCMSYRSAERHVIRLLQKEYVQDSIELGFVRATQRFWWE